MNRLIVVTGVSCSGKDFILERVRPLLPRSLEVVSFGEELFTTLSGEFGWISSRDHLRQLSYEQLREPIKRLVSEVLIKQPVVLNTHIVFSSRGDLVFTREIQYRLLPMSYIHISSPAEEIFERRKIREREGEEESIEQIETHQDISAFVTSRIARDLGSPFVHIWSRADNIETNLQALQRELSTLL